MSTALTHTASTMNAMLGMRFQRMDTHGTLDKTNRCVQSTYEYYILRISTEVAAFSVLFSVETAAISIEIRSIPKVLAL